MSRLLPKGRFRFINWVGRHAPPAFVATLPRELGGLQYWCNLRDGISRQVYFTGAYEPQELAVLVALLKSGQTIVDVGANWGFHTLIAASLTGPTGRVLALEPDPTMVQLLEANVELNRLGERVTVLRKAASNCSKLMAFVSESEGALSRLARLEKEAEAIKQVESVCLDDLFESLGQDTIHLVKMDIEGAEALALPGMNRWLSSHRIQRLLLEVHASRFQPAYQTDVHKVLSHLLDAGYRGFTWKGDYATMRRAAYEVHLDPATLLEPFDLNQSRPDRYHILWISSDLVSPFD